MQKIDSSFSSKILFFTFLLFLTCAQVQGEEGEPDSGLRRNDKTSQNDEPSWNDEHSRNDESHRNDKTSRNDEPTRNDEKEQKKVIILEKGESVNIPSPHFEKIWLSKAGIISVQDRGSSLNIQARQEGEVLLNLGSRLYLIQVLNEEKKKILIVVNEFLSQRMGLKARLVKDQIHMTGELHRIKDFKDLSELAQTLNLNYLFEAEVNPFLRQKLQTYIQKK